MARDSRLVRVTDHVVITVAPFGHGWPDASSTAFLRVSAKIAARAGRLLLEAAMAHVLASSVSTSSRWEEELNLWLQPSRVRGGLLPPAGSSRPRVGTHVTGSPENPRRFREPKCGGMRRRLVPIQARLAGCWVAVPRAATAEWPHSAVISKRTGIRCGHSLS